MQKLMPAVEGALVWNRRTWERLFYKGFIWRKDFIIGRRFVHALVNNNWHGDWYCQRIYGRQDGYVLVRFTDIFMSVPSFLFMVVINSMFPPKVWSMVIILGLFEWCQIARITRAETLSLKERDFVLASKHLGASHAQIIFGHIIPNMSSSVIVAGSLAVARAILTESALSFMGLGFSFQRPPGGRCFREPRFILWTCHCLQSFQAYLSY